MALKHVNPRAETNGNGNSYETAYNTFAGLTWGSDYYRVYPGILRETVTFGASNAKIIGAEPDDMPVIDCENSRTSGINLNGASSCEVAWITVINQNAAPANAGIRVTGSGHYIHHNLTRNCYVGIHANNSANNRIVENWVDCGNPLTPSIAYGIRLNGGSCTGNRVVGNRVYSTAVGMEFIATIEFYAAGTGNWQDGNIVTCPMGDGPSLRLGTTGCYQVRNLIYGPQILDGLVIEGSSGNFTWNNTVFHPGDVESHFGPVFKMGDEFGAGTPSANNDVANNLFVSLGTKNVMNLVEIGTGNTFRNNRLWRPSGGNIVNLDTGAGVSALTFAQWQAAGFSTDETFLAPDVTDGYRPLPGSALLTAGVDLDYLRDIEGKQGKSFIGAYNAAMLREVAA